MGIPGLNEWVLGTQAKLRGLPRKQIDSLFIDMNGLLHNAAGESYAYSEDWLKIRNSELRLEAQRAQEARKVAMEKKTDTELELEYFQTIVKLLGKIVLQAQP